MSMNIYAIQVPISVYGIYYVVTLERHANRACVSHICLRRKKYFHCNRSNISYSR